MKPFGVQFKEGEVDASLTLHKVKTIYSICQLRVSIIFDSAMAITTFMSISPEIRLFDIIQYFEQFISFLAWLCINFRYFLTYQENGENQNGRSKMAGQSIENFFLWIIDCYRLPISMDLQSAIACSQPPLPGKISERFFFRGEAADRLNRRLMFIDIDWID